VLSYPCSSLHRAVPSLVYPFSVPFPCLIHPFTVPSLPLIIPSPCFPSLIHTFTFPSHVLVHPFFFSTVLPFTVTFPHLLSSPCLSLSCSSLRRGFPSLVYLCSTCHFYAFVLLNSVKSSSFTFFVTDSKLHLICQCGPVEPVAKSCQFYGGVL
jgi:hypothetical protein